MMLSQSILVSAVIASSLGTFIGPPAAVAAPAASPACATGYGQAGTGGNGQAGTAGGAGCVVIEYVVGGTTYFETFNYTGALQTWEVPAGAETAKFITYGAGGGGTNIGAVRTNGLDNNHVAVAPANSVSWYSGNAGEGLLPVAHNGGAGGSATGTFVVTPGETLSVLVGQAGIGNADDRCLPVVTRDGAANGPNPWLDITRRDTAGNINLWPLNGVTANTDPNARQGFGGGGRASAFNNTRAFFPIALTADSRDHDECINPYFAAGGGRSEVLRGSTRLVGAGGGGGAGFFGAGGAGATMASGNAAATGGDGAGTPVVTNHPTPITVSQTYGSGGTGSAGGAGGLTATVRDNYTGTPTFTPYDLWRPDGIAGSAGNGGQAPQGGGGGGGGCFGGGGGGDGGGGGGGSSCLIAGSVLNFTTTSSDATYVPGDSINITANMTKPIADGAQITVTLDTGETVLLTKTGPYTLSGTYVVGASATTGDLTVSSYTLTTPPVDVDGITMTSTTVPSGSNNIAGRHAIVIGAASAPGGGASGGGAPGGASSGSTNDGGAQPAGGFQAIDDSFAVSAGVPVSGSVAGNDGAPVGATFALASGPSRGTAVVNPDGTFTFTPAPGFVGTDSFTYTVCDVGGSPCSTATVTITVRGSEGSPGGSVPGNTSAINARPQLKAVSATSTNPVMFGSRTLAKRGSIAISNLGANAWGQRVVVKGKGTWVVKKGRVMFTPHSRFYGRTTIQYRVISKSGDTTLSTFTAVRAAMPALIDGGR
jgi:hypothetical protein